MTMLESPQTLVGDVEYACRAVADLLVDLGKSTVLAQASMLPVAAECLTAKSVLERLGALLTPTPTPIQPAESDVGHGPSNGQIEDLKPCFEVILHSMSEILLDIDHEITRLRRYHTWGDPLASSKAVPVLQDFFIDVRFDLRRNRSSLCLMIECLERGSLLGATIKLVDQTTLVHRSSAKTTESSRMQPLVAIELHKVSDQPGVRRLLVKYRTKRTVSYETASKLSCKLHEAITRCDHNAVHKCLLSKANPDMPVEQSRVVPIHRALTQAEVSLASGNKVAFRASASIVTALVIAGAKLQAPDENGRTPLTRAVMNEMPDSLISLMLESKVSVNAKDKQRNTALHHAAMKDPLDDMGNIDTIKVLLAYGANQSLKNKRGRMPLHEAVSLMCIGRSRELLDYGADLDMADNNGWTPVFGAVTQGNAALTKLLCDRGAIVDKKDKSGQTVLHYAISQGCKETAEILLNAGADANLITKGETPLCRAASKSNLTLVKLLLAHGANVALPSPGYYGALPIHIAAMGNELAVLHTLLESGSPINAEDDERRTPLRWAMDGGKNELVHFLLSKGAAK
ncbi:ankyrin repeat-containing domain protein [Jackrogersella minutella]|nr:ankyrin repeat-containing domain protein [Jackrogersella minutella]